MLIFTFLSSDPGAMAREIREAVRHRNASSRSKKPRYDANPSSTPEPNPVGMDADSRGLVTPLPSSITSRLSLEVYEHIIDGLHTDSEGQSPSQLSVCSLVCRAWLAPSRRRLFASVNLRPEFVAFLRASSHAYDTIVPHIRDLGVGGGWLHHDRSDFSSTVLFMTDLVKLRTLNLEAWSWSYLSASTASKLLRGEGPAFRVLTALDLKYIRFPSFSALATLISAFVRLKTLAFDNVTWETSDDAMPLAPPFVSNLTKLHIVACSNEVLISWLFAEALEDPTVMLKLRSLSLPDILPNEAGNIDHLVSSTSSSLEHLDVGFMGHSTDDAPVILKLAEKIDLSHTQLHSLHIHQIVLYQFPGTPPHSSQSSPALNLPTTWLVSLLSTIRSAHFSRLTLSIWLGEERQLDSLDWDGFVRILSNERFASLMQVEFCVRGLGKAMNDVVKGWISDRMSGWARVTECLRITFG